MKVMTFQPVKLLPNKLSLTMVFLTTLLVGNYYSVRAQVDVHTQRKVYSTVQHNNDEHWIVEYSGMPKAGWIGIALKGTPLDTDYSGHWRDVSPTGSGIIDLGASYFEGDWEVRGFADQTKTRLIASYSFVTRHPKGGEGVTGAGSGGVTGGGAGSGSGSGSGSGGGGGNSGGGVSTGGNSTTNVCGYQLGSGIKDKWAALGGEKGLLGCAMSNEIEAKPSPQGTSGRWAGFANGIIVWTRDGKNAGRSFEISGCMWDLYKGMGGSTSWLGMPISDGRITTDGARQDFEGGYIRWDSKTRQCVAERGNGGVSGGGPGAGAGTSGGGTSAGSSNMTNVCGYQLGSGIKDKWTALGGEKGVLGCAMSNEIEAKPSPQGTSGRWAGFTNGIIIWIRDGKNAGRSFEISGCMWDLYKGMGGSTSWLGMPTSDGRFTTEGARQDFEGGYILWDSKTRKCASYRWNEGKQKAAPISYVWERVGTGDFAGSDIGSSDGFIPDPKMAKEGLTAVCWDDQAYKNGGKVWCTYKTVSSDRYYQGPRSGVLYKAVPK